MARLSDDDKKLVLADYHTGKYSQRKLAEKHNVSLGTINKLTKDIIAQNEHLVNAQTSLLVAKSDLPNEQMNAIMNTANDEARRLNLVFGALEKTAKRTMQLLEDNITYEKINVAPGVQNFEARELNMQDMKLASDTLVGIGKGFGIIKDKPEIAIQNNQNNIPQININIENE